MSATEASSKSDKTVTELKRAVEPVALTDNGSDMPGDRNNRVRQPRHRRQRRRGSGRLFDLQAEQARFPRRLLQDEGPRAERGEMAAYTMGESTPRRLAIYRHLAQATLDGRGPDSPAIPGGAKKAPVKDSGSLNTKLLGVAVALLLVTLAYLVAKLGLPGAR